MRTYLQPRTAAFPFWAAITAAAGIILAAACAPAARIETGPPPEIQLKIADAAAQAARGCYVGFKNALRAYQELYAQPAFRPRIASAYLRTLLLMMIREREVGILNPTDYPKAAAFIRENPGLQSMMPLFDVADALATRTRGIMQDINPVAVKRLYDDVLKQVQADLRTKALADDYYAYLYVAFFTGYGLYAEKKDEFVADLLARYPQSVLMKYKNAIYPRSNPDALQALIQAEPEFYEAYYNLGELAIGAQTLLEAEKNFLKAYEGLPESPQATIYLGSIYLATEEFEKSLEFYDRTIALSPQYRDALLGKGICLSTMGRYTEALVPLAKIVELQFYMLGESHYWLAWNYHALKDDAKAEAEIEQSKPRLPTNSEVYGLSGTIAFDRGELAKAEKEFLEALRYNGANTEALFGLGRLYAQKEMWKESAGYYETSARVFERNEGAIADKIDQIKKSTLSEERKARLLAKKDQQLKITQATKATAFYNAAASYFNTKDPGLMAKAADLASRAAAHLQTKERAEALLKQIKQ
jgi:tetratricopeptide (TPR) repeat protein